MSYGTIESFAKSFNNENYSDDNVAGDENFDGEIDDDRKFTKEEELVLRFAIEELKNKQLTQKELIDRISQRIKNEEYDLIGRNKIHKILNDFEGSVFSVKRGDNHSKYYRVIKDSEIARYLMA